MVSSVGHLQLSVEILWEIFCVCRKIANSCPAYFLTNDAAEGYTEDRATEEFILFNSDGRLCVARKSILYIAKGHFSAPALPRAARAGGPGQLPPLPPRLRRPCPHGRRKRYPYPIRSVYQFVHQLPTIIIIIIIIITPTISNAP